MNNNNRFLKNVWYVAALSTEVDDNLFRRKILGTSVLIYRKQNGEPVALRDRCPHRFAPLSMGKKVGDDVVCHYHGLRFDCSGTCVSNPHGTGAIPRGAAVQSFPLQERDGFLWIWMGDAVRANPDDIPDYSEYSKRGDNACCFAYMLNQVNYELLTDNIMDLTHIDHVHGPLINTRGKLSEQIPKLEESEQQVIIRWDWLADPAMLLLASHLDAPEEPANQFFKVTWNAPACMLLEVGAVQNGDDYFNDGVLLYDAHIMTPETETSTHYFFASTRNYKMDDAEYNHMHIQGMTQAFVEEDKPVLEAQQDEMGTTDLWSLQPIFLSSDAGNLTVRRKLAALIAQENEGVIAVEESSEYISDTA